jgi:hypothetical protein
MEKIKILKNTIEKKVKETFNIEKSKKVFLAT